VFTLSAVSETPQFSNSRSIASGWRLSPIFKVLSGDCLNLTSGLDRALNGNTSQRPQRILANPYGKKTVGSYLNPAAFAQPALGTSGNTGMGSIK
jgi:hypothetical protein